MKHVWRDNLLKGDLVPFDLEMAREAAAEFAKPTIEWISNPKTGLETPEMIVKDPSWFISGALWQHRVLQEMIYERDLEIAELKKFKADAIKMAADFYLNPSGRR